MILAIGRCQGYSGTGLIAMRLVEGVAIADVLPEAGHYMGLVLMAAGT